LTPRPKQNLALLMALYCVLVWGLSYAVTRSAVQQIPPQTLALLRFVIAFILMWLLTCKRRIRLHPRDLKWILALALSGVTIYFALENEGLKRTTASHASLIIATIPLGTELVTAWQQRQWPGWTVWLGTLLALTGVGLIVGRDAGQSQATVTGDLLVFGAVACWIVYTYVVQHISGRYPNLLISRWMMLAGAVTLAPGAIWELTVYPVSLPTPAAWAQVLFLSVGCSALAFDFWNRAVPALGPTVINTLIYFIPLVGVVGGVLFLEEPVTPALLLGGAMITAGVVLARLSPAVEGKAA